MPCPLSNFKIMHISLKLFVCKEEYHYDESDIGKSKHNVNARLERHKELREK